MAHIEGKDRETGPEGTENEDAIAASLRRAYEDVVKEPLPDRFIELLAKLKNEEGK